MSSTLFFFFLRIQCQAHLKVLNLSDVKKGKGLVRRIKWGMEYGMEYGMERIGKL